MAGELQAADLGLLTLLYAENAAFDGSLLRITQLLKLLMETGPDRGYLPDLSKSMFVFDTLEKEVAAKREFTAKGLDLNF